MFCLVDKNSDYLKWSPGAILFVFTMSGWTLLTICVTVYCKRVRRQDKQVANNMLNCLDISKSWNDLLGNSRPDTNQSKRFNFDAISNFIVIAWSIVVLAHSGIFAYACATDVLISSLLASSNPSMTVLKVGFFVVDKFFVIVGMLIGFATLKRLDKTRSAAQPASELSLFFKNWLLMSVSRYLRIVPVLFLVFWFEKSLLLRLGSGPSWDYGLDKDTGMGACLATSWSRPFDFISNSIGGTNCIPPAWFLYSDLYANIIFVPPLVYMLAIGYTKLVYLITVGLTIISTVVVLHFDRLDPALDNEVRHKRWIEMKMRTEINLIYTTQFHRVPRVLIGLLAGHALHWYSGLANNERAHTNEESKSQHEVIVPIDELKKAPMNSTFQRIIARPSAQSPLSSNWPAWFRGPATYLALLISLLLILIPMFEGQFRRYLGESLIRPGAMVFLHITPIVWTICTAIILLRLTTDWQNNWFARIGSNQLVKSMNKLGFGIYLLHWYFFLYAYGINPTGVQFSTWLFYSNFGMVYFFVTLAATVLFVFVENPLSKLTRRLIPA